ncbi:MAG: hypothetical protein B9S32_13175 [Verrucomicrobia bacterium Tous-C9LFEB]|nr:MAG: hypothetical protein B9S32_13175 [Verrucomicrobia bacterium Tous-C9LFEB]
MTPTERNSMQSSSGFSFRIGSEAFLLNNRPFLIRCGEIHFSRVLREQWVHRLKMCRAMGLNTVCVYLMWNFHEWERGHYDWSGQADVAEFCRLAQQEGLWVLLRPGHYSCAEWEMGGLPWWLLKNKTIQLRSNDPEFLKPATAFLMEVGRVLAPLQVDRGGPILMVQVENEYGSFGSDVVYMGTLRQSLLDAGFAVPLFACNPAGDISKGYRPDLFQVVNFGPGNARGAFEVLKKFQPEGPLMNGEFYPGWFDTWGVPHQDKPIDQALDDLEYMLTHGHSFSIYMAHGGTTFGLWSGADRPFKPDSSSYDYNAPISEAGWATSKFHRIRELFSRHLNPGETIPAIPETPPISDIAPFAMTERADIFDNLPSHELNAAQPQTMEICDHGRGCMVYRTPLFPGPEAVLSVEAVHDFGWVYLDGKQVGIFDRRRRRYRCTLPARFRSVCLEILVEAMGRVNFGEGIADRKGIHAPVKLAAPNGTEILQNWTMLSLPLDGGYLRSLSYQPIHFPSCSGPAFWRGYVERTEPNDTFLDMRNWGKGVVWLNGFCLGRYWNIGPTQTLYCPGPLWKPGRNEVVILDFLGTRRPELAGLKEPILNEMHLECDFSQMAVSQGSIQLSDLEPITTGSFSDGGTWKIVYFSRSHVGRYVCLQALNAHDEGCLASGAGIELMDAAGHVLSSDLWQLLWTDSDDSNQGGSADNLLNGQSSSGWMTKGAAPFPHYVVIDLGQELEIGGFRFLPREGGPETPGRIKDYRFFQSHTPFGLIVDTNVFNAGTVSGVSSLRA